MKPQKLTRLVLVMVLLVGAGLSWERVQSARQSLYAELERIGSERLNLYASTVEAAYRRFDYLPFLVAEDPDVVNLLQSPERELSARALNRKLARWQSEAGADVLYLMNRQGQVVASSNWQQPSSFIGQHYAFRPYFRDALAGEKGRFFAVGVTTGRPGLFLSRPVKSPEGIAGVVVAKIDLTQLEQNWAAGGESVWVSDSDGVIFLSSHAGWRYRSLAPLDAGTRASIRGARKYSGHVIEPLVLQWQSPSPAGNRILELATPGSVQKAGAFPATFMLHERQIPELGWTLYYLSDLGGLSDRIGQALVTAWLVAALLAIFGLFLLSRYRYAERLSQQVAERTEALRQTHEELIQSEKLAALGQLSAGLVHEISQPLSALQTYLASTRMLVRQGQASDALDTLGEAEGLIRRVSRIVSHLKTFARRSRGVRVPVDMVAVVENALMVVQPLLKKTQVNLKWSPPEAPVRALADEIRAEQVLINLIRNAVDAVQEAPVAAPVIEVNLCRQGAQVEVRVADNGAGIAPDTLPDIFDPFFTTKPPGEGLGLGLSVSFGIAQDLGGELTAANRPEGGSVFCFRLAAAEEAHQPHV
ncbi:MAG: sensor histidine kinase [Gammaproteobacteria bacterium]|nr:MAG: sensor histidine kinase [Gammaproteobacteria bacterium]